MVSVHVYVCKSMCVHVCMCVGCVCACLNVFERVVYIHICKVCIRDCEHVYVCMPACALTVSLCMYTCVLHVSLYVSIYTFVGVCVSACVWYVGHI